MKLNDKSADMLLKELRENANHETLEYVLGELKATYGDRAPDENAVKSFLLFPDEKTQLNVRERFVIIDKLLECAEIEFRTACDLIRYKQLKDAGVVDSVDEFIALFRSEQQ